MKKKTLDLRAAMKYATGKNKDLFYKSAIVIAFLSGVKYGRKTAVEEILKVDERGWAQISIAAVIDAIKARSKK